MAVLFGRMRSISRGNGSSAMQAASYRSCSALTQVITDKATGISTNVNYDYSDKKGLVFSQIFASGVSIKGGFMSGYDDIDPPAWVFDRKNCGKELRI